jgi:hypothetical protein
MRSKPAAHCASIALWKVASLPGSAYSITSRCGVRVPAPHCQRLGSLAPTSPSRRARLASLAMPETKSAANASTIASLTPRARMPSPVSAICSAVGGGGSTVSAVQIGTVASQRRAASRSLTRRSRNEASVWCL